MLEHAQELLQEIQSMEAEKKATVGSEVEQINSEQEGDMELA